LLCNGEFMTKASVNAGSQTRFDIWQWLMGKPSIA
jgi:hypothetical protein